MALSEKEITIVRLMYLDNSWPKDIEYLEAIAGSDDFARAEIDKYREKRASELAIDAQINQVRAEKIAESQEIFML